MIAPGPLVDALHAYVFVFAGNEGSLLTDTASVLARLVGAQAFGLAMFMVLVAQKIEACLAVPDAEIALAEKARTEFSVQIHQALNSVDVLVTPTTPCVAPLLDGGEGARLTFFPHGLKFIR